MDRINGRVATECRFCGGVLPKNAKLYCSNSCQHEFEYLDAVSRWIGNEVSGGSWHGVSNYVRRWLSEQKGEKCWECGWCVVNKYTKKVPVQVEHVDGNPYNHRPENLKLICPCCHSLTATWGSGNMGMGRRERYLTTPQ